MVLRMKEEHSEFYGFTWRGLIINPICRCLLPLLLLKYKDFWGLRCVTLRRQGRIGGGVLAKCYHLYVAQFNAEVPLSVKFDGPPCLPHGLNGIFIGSLTHIGRNVTILQQVTIGEDTFSSQEDNSRRFIGDNVFIGAGAKIIGGIVIGKNCRIGANCCVYKDMPDNTIAVSAPTRIIQKSDLVNFFRRGNQIFKDGGWMND